MWGELGGWDWYTYRTDIITEILRKTYVIAQETRLNALWCSELEGSPKGRGDIYCWSVTQSCTTLCDPTDCSMPGFPVLHHPLELAQTHVHWIGDAVQPAHPLLSPSPPAFNLFQHQGVFQMSQFLASGGQSIGVSVSTSVLPVNIQYWFYLGWTGLISLPSKGLSRVFSSTTVRKHCDKEDHRRSGFKRGGALGMRSLILRISSMRWLLEAKVEILCREAQRKKSKVKTEIWKSSANEWY